MMEDKHLLLISLVFSLIGLGVLLVVGDYVDVNTTKIADVLELPVETAVKVQGSISQVYAKKETTFFQVKDASDSIAVVIFEKVPLQNGASVMVEGKVTKYKGKMEIIATKVTSVA